MMTRLVLAILLCAVSLAHGATLTNSMKTWQGGNQNLPVTFTPLLGWTTNGTDIINGAEFAVVPRNGLLTATNVQPGLFKVTQGTKSVYIAVPTDSDTNTYWLAGLITNGLSVYSYTNGQGQAVKRIIAGTNIVISPTTGVGDVTINSTATGSIQSTGGVSTINGYATNLTTYNRTNYFGTVSGQYVTNREPYWVRVTGTANDAFKYSWYDPTGKMMIQIRDYEHPNYVLYFGDPSDSTAFDAFGFALRARESGNTDPRYAFGFMGGDYNTWRLTDTNFHFSFKNADTDFEWTNHNIAGIQNRTNLYFGDPLFPTTIRGLSVTIPQALNLGGAITNTTTDGTWKIYYDTDNYYWKFDSGSDSVHFTTLGADTLGVSDQLTASGWLRLGNSASKTWTTPNIAHEIRTWNSNGVFYTSRGNADGNAWVSTNQFAFTSDITSTTNFDTLAVTNLEFSNLVGEVHGGTNITDSTITTNKLDATAYAAFMSRSIDGSNIVSGTVSLPRLVTNDVPPVGKYLRAASATQVALDDVYASNIVSGGTIPLAALPSAVLTNNNASAVTISNTLTTTGNIAANGAKGVIVGGGSDGGLLYSSSKVAISSAAGYKFYFDGQDFSSDRAGGTLGNAFPWGSVKLTNLLASYATVTNTVTAQGGLYYLASSNGIAGTNILQPDNAWASLTLIGDKTFALAAQSTYYPITNFDNAMTNGFTAVATNGMVTNLTAGFYNIRMTASGLGTAANSQLYECGIFTNNVECTLIEWQRTVSSTARGSMAAGGIVYLPANCGIQAKIKSDAASPDSITFGRFNLTVSAP